MARKGLIRLPGFEGVDEGGGAFHIPEGDYLMKCTGVTPAVSKASDNDMLVFTFTGIEGKSKGKKFWLYCTLTDEALWKLRQTLKGLGQPTPDDASDFDPNDVIDVECLGTVVDNEYEGKTRTKLSEIALVNEDDDKPAKPATKSGDGKSSTKLTKVAASEIEEMDEDALEDLVAKYDLDIDLSTQKTKRRKANAVIAAMQQGKMLEA